MSLLPVHERLAELYILSRKRPLTDGERTEMEQCLAVNARHCWTLAELKNLSLAACMTSDKEWLHEICREIERVQDGGAG